MNSSNLSLKQKQNQKKSQLQESKQMSQQILISQTKDFRATQNIQKMSKQHLTRALQFYNQFQNETVQKIQKQLSEIKKVLSMQLQRVVKKTQSKLKNNYLKTLQQTLSTFYLKTYVNKQVQQILKSINNLKQKIYSYINDFCHNILSRSIKKNNQLSLFYYQNSIKSLQKNWCSVSSRCPVNIAQIRVKGFVRPQTSWLALGVTKKLKQFGPIASSFNKEDFMGNIYLNGSDDLFGYRVKKDLHNDDSFVVECENRLVWVYRTSQGKNNKEAFIMDDNVQYYIYIAIKGPIQLSFEAE